MSNIFIRNLANAREVPDKDYKRGLIMLAYEKINHFIVYDNYHFPRSPTPFTAVAGSHDSQCRHLYTEMEWNGEKYGDLLKKRIFFAPSFASCSPVGIFQSILISIF